MPTPPHPSSRAATTGLSGASGDPQPPTRGHGAARRAVTWVVTWVVTAGVVGGGWLAGQRWSDELAGVWTSAEAAVPAAAGIDEALLPPADERNFPTPGYEESDAPLAAPPAVPDAPGRYAFSQTQTGADGVATPVAWSPCRPVHYVVDATGAPTAFHEEVRAATAELSAATGLVLVDDGVVTEAPDADREPFLPSVYGDRWAPVLIRFADETDVADLAGAVAGVAAPVTVTDPATGLTHVVSGAVYIDTETLAAPDAGGDPRHVLVLRHELAHLVGLAHVDDAGQLMSPQTTDLTTFQDGDRAGLAALGRGACAPGV